MKNDEEEWFFAKTQQIEQESLLRRFIHATRPKRLLTFKEAIKLQVENKND